MKILGKITLLLLMVILGSCEEDEAIIPITDPSEEVNSDYWGIDPINKIIVYNGNSVSIVNGELTIGDIVLEVESNDQTISIGKSYCITYLEEEYKLYYSQLPIISINTTSAEILDDPKILGTVKIHEKDKEAFTSFIGIELRGGVSQTHPKKSYSLELWEDETGDSKAKKSLLGMRDDDDWILDGMWNEPNRIRDFTSHDLWLEIGRVENPNTKIGISRKYCELFLNGKYNGVYYLSEKIDRKQLDLEVHNNQIEGELYKGYTWAGGVTYTGLTEYDNSSTTWNGYEAKYPDDIGIIDWANLYNHISFIINSSQVDFNSEISTRIDMENAVDYFLFLNLIYASDNTGKNVYTCKLDKSSLYFFAAWDMDGSFGNDWTGERIDVTNKILSNGLYERLLADQNFKNDLKLRWTELRVDILNTESLKKRFVDNNDYLVRNAIHMRENLIPELSQNYSDTEIFFIESWIERRIIFLDEYFGSL